MYHHRPDQIHEQPVSIKAHRRQYQSMNQVRINRIQVNRVVKRYINITISVESIHRQANGA